MISENYCDFNDFTGFQSVAFYRESLHQFPQEAGVYVLLRGGSDQVRVRRAQNFLENEYIYQRFNWYKSFVDVENHVKVASMDDLIENDLNVLT